MNIVQGIDNPALRFQRHGYFMLPEKLHYKGFTLNI
jgi:hypothetical protein